MRVLSKSGIVAGLFFVAGVACVLCYPFEASQPNVTIEVRYMHYACGECFVQNRVMKASGQDGNLIATRSSVDEAYSPVRYIGWDIVVRYRGDNEALVRYLDSNVVMKRGANCAEPSFRLKGQLKRKLVYALLYEGDRYDGTYFEAQSAIALAEPSANCSEASEAPL
ncbi:hypothetical protein A9R05_15790 [Burkholderia sp. KK1]|nr:hypothetical protein A9R05_15790 [Burkholderia sp. KK1]